jgi:hypothetical protein
MRAGRVKIFSGFDPEELEDEFRAWRKKYPHANVEGVKYAMAMNGNAMRYSVLVIFYYE